MSSLAGGQAAAPRPHDARRYAALPNPFPMHRGGELLGGVVAYETWGQLNANASNALLLFTGLSPSAHAASSAQDPTPGWWEKMVGPNQAIDTNRWFVVCVNSLGSCFGSSGPAAINPATGDRWRLDFPDLSVEDIARAGYETLRSLGIDRLAAVVGASLGGMSALAFIALFPGSTRRLISISGTDAASPFAIALRSVQREAILRDPQWLAGQYPLQQPPRNGMRLARKLGTITYRSAVEWNERFGRQPLTRIAPGPAPFAAEFAIEGYLEVQAEKFADQFDANSYLYLSRAMDRFDLATHGTSSRAVLARAGLEAALIIGVESDLLFPIAEQARIAAALADGGVATQFVPLICPEGHDAFLIDIAKFGEPIRAFL